MTKVVSIVAPVLTRFVHARVRQTVGLPPEASGVHDEREALPWPIAVLVKEESAGNVYVYRIAASGASAGDTWHPTVDEARQQAEYEYEGVLGKWERVPDDVRDAWEHALEVGRRCVTDRWPLPPVSR